MTGMSSHKFRSCSSTTAELHLKVEKLDACIRPFLQITYIDAALSTSVLTCKLSYVVELYVFFKDKNPYILYCTYPNPISVLVHWVSFSDGEYM